MNGKKTTLYSKASSIAEAVRNTDFLAHPRCCPETIHNWAKRDGWNYIVDKGIVKYNVDDVFNGITKQKPILCSPYGDFYLKEGENARLIDSYNNPGLFKDVRKHLTSKHRYMVTNFGRVYNSTLNHELQQSEDAKGYKHVYLTFSDYDKHPVLVHTLVAMAFCPNAKGYDEIHHKNGNPGDNRAENLLFVRHDKHQSTIHPILNKFGKDHVGYLALMNMLEKENRIPEKRYPFQFMKEPFRTISGRTANGFQYHAFVEESTYDDIKSGKRKPEDITSNEFVCRFDDSEQKFLEKLYEIGEEFPNCNTKGMNDERI